MEVKLSENTVVGKRYTIVVPKSIRKRVGIEEGQQVWIRAQGGEIIIEPLPKDPYETLRRVIRKPYNERRDSRRAEELLKRLASTRHRSPVRR